MNSSELFETPPYLEQKLGSQQFEAIPQAPGIYRFYDENEALLYVGKAKNLRRRLFTYKRARPGQTSRKEAALISKINRFDFVVLESEQAAILHENHLIREHRPKFNHANKHTESYYFITVLRSESALVFGLSMNPSGQSFPEKEKYLYQECVPLFYTEFDSKTYGCFKGHRTVRLSLGALLQLLWMAEFGSISPHFLPIQLSRNLTPMRFHFPLINHPSFKTEELMTMLDNWFLGISADLLHYLQEKIQQPEDSTFTKNFIDGNVEILESYFKKNLHCYRIMRELKKDKESHLVKQDELDDLITKLNGRDPSPGPFPMP